jgi:uncharacterized MAPEG superfamily protein
MTPELTALTLAALLQFGQITLYSILANMQVGPTKALSPRDTPVQLTGMAGRAQRAMNNHFEGLILFTIAVLVVHLADKGSGLTALLAQAYLVARVLYIPAYLYGWAPWRSVIWGVGWLATLGMLILAIL